MHIDIVVKVTWQLMCGDTSTTGGCVCLHFQQGQALLLDHMELLVFSVVVAAAVVILYYCCDWGNCYWWLAFGVTNMCFYHCCPDLVDVAGLTSTGGLQ